MPSPVQCTLAIRFVYHHFSPLLSICHSLAHFFICSLARLLLDYSKFRFACREKYKFNDWKRNDKLPLWSVASSDNENVSETEDENTKTTSEKCWRIFDISIEFWRRWRRRQRWSSSTFDQHTNQTHKLIRVYNSVQFFLFICLFLWLVWMRVFLIVLFELCHIPCFWIIYLRGRKSIV